MSIESEQDLEGLKRSGRVVALTVQQMARHLKPGITTKELDDIGAAFLRMNGARSAPILAYNFPGWTCISVNDEAAHGIPGDRVIQAGDLINIDVSAELDGYWTDMGSTFAVPPVSPSKQKLMTCTKQALQSAISVARAGQSINAIGGAVEAHARKCGYKVIRNLTGHGVGRTIHEEPRNVLNYYDSKDRRKLREGTVLTIEPFLSTKAEAVIQMPDGWTLKTPDGSLLAQYEHTIVITKGKPIIITAA